MFLALAFLLAPPPADCTYDRAAMLALDQQAFDQDMTGGWRGLSQRGCEAEAADLIHDWHTAHPPQDPTRAGLLFWHEGQLRANLNQKTQAIALFEQARKTEEQDAGFGWNLYVDGSIAFLRGDRAAFDAAHARLAALPRPAGFDPRGPDGKPVAIRWPMNLNVLDGFARCWGMPYKQAYGCAVPMQRVIRPAA
ncbi:hypothetical protein [Sphingomonas aracearum]|uniref:Tetratricopeptide repeat protein n=1 Tax=Sphingomonas aracearum TaxID=2283317 RepID=A0A369VXN5_9SPHN|nr:hypothetical protein [Sphingomonas aracearum]RDE06385.1 hypothetical protein DVW87_01265 [Sphingomonas aracearum]